MWKQFDALDELESRVIDNAALSPAGHSLCDREHQVEFEG